ncbi:MAG TPA: SurA N-terminal domain-containing protein [Candidatus Saccharimonadales bacterium]|nr:SurA N-terminal domain-containing protein [Candidatus Saccharimonadales bacterium]
MAAKKKTTTKKTSSAPKTVKKAAAPKKEKVIETPIEESVVIESIENSEPITTAYSENQVKKNKKPQIVGLIIVVIIIALLYAFRSQFVAATVNGQPISRAAYNAELQKEAGQKSMDTLVTKMLVIQEANKENVTVSDKEVNDQIDTIKKQLAKQGETLDQALKSQGLTTADLKEQIKISQLIQKMLAKNVKVTDKEVDDYMAKAATQAQQDQTTNPDVTPTPTPSKDQVRQMLQQEKLNTQFQPWLQNLRQKAKITYFVNNNS